MLAGQHFDYLTAFPSGMYQSSFTRLFGLIIKATHNHMWIDIQLRHAVSVSHQSII